MDLSKLTIGEAREIAALFSAQPQYHPFKIGANYFLRTVTHHLTGRLVSVGPHELVLEDAAWIADDGRFSDALVSGNFNEVEPFPPGQVIVGRGSLIDAVEISSALPRSQK